MGLDASVNCNCYRDGTAAVCPYGKLTLDEEGDITIDLPYEGNEDAHHEFYAWKKTACPHGFEYCCEHVSNWAGVRSFQQALEDTDLCVLKREIPNLNGGQLNSEGAAAMLQDLAAFNNLAAVGATTWLVDSDRDLELYEYIAGYDGKFVLDGRHGADLGVDDYGFFIIERAEPAREVFRSLRFEQVLHGEHHCTYIDLDSGNTWTGHTTLHGGTIPWPDGRETDDNGKCCFRYPTRWHVRQRARMPAEFDYIVEPLMKLCRASIETGNPILWR